MEFKRLQTILSHKIGISPNQFSVFISSPESRRRIPVTSKVNFSVISRETKCFFLVVLKRSKRDRRRRSRSQYQLGGDDCFNKTPSFFLPPSQVQENPLENAVFLRRGTGINQGGGGAGSVMPLAGRVEWEKRARDLRMERSRYLMNMGLLKASGFGLAQSGGAVVCEECSRAEEMGFHWCAYDPVVTFGFRSPAGPISRPAR